MITVDEMGFAMANGGLSASLRDLGRFGYLVGNGGSLGTHRACSPEWAAGIRAGGNPELLRETNFGREFPRGSYRAQWWVTGNEAGALESRGIYGQFLWIDPVADVVIVKLSSLPEALDPIVTSDHHRAFASIAAALG